MIKFETKIIPCDSNNDLRKESKEDWISNHASGTLYKTSELGMNHYDLYLHERIAWEFGDIFECYKTSRVLIGAPITEGDCKAITEVGWYAEKFIEKMKLFAPLDKFQVVYLHISLPNGQTKEGIGMICWETTAKWFPENRILCGIITEYDNTKKCYLPAVNPS